MTDPDSPALEEALSGLRSVLDDAEPRLRARIEWKQADEWLRALDEGEQSATSPEDRLRDAAARHDLLELARVEVEQEAEVDARFRQERLGEDEVLLEELKAEIKLYSGFVFAGFLLPPFLLGPLGTLLVIGWAPVVLGFLRMRKEVERSRGRQWLILQGRVNDQLSRVRFAHAMAGVSLAMLVLWFLFAVFAGETLG